MLIEFITQEWKSNESKSMIGQKTLFVTCGQTCWRIGQMGASLDNDLKYSQEEVDTRMFLHAKHASDQGYTSVIVVSEDTDVFVLLIAFAKEIPASLYQKKWGTSTRVRYMDIRKLSTVLGDKLSQALIAFHAFAGCDTVSAFADRGNTGPLKQLKKDEVVIDAFVQIGTSWNVDQSLTSKLQEFTCRMYAASSKTCKLNILRYEIFFRREKLIPAHSPYVRTVSSSTYIVQITKLGCGGGHCCQCLTFLNQTAMDGSRKLMGALTWIGYTDRLLLMLFWSFLHASAS